MSYTPSFPTVADAVDNADNNLTVLDDKFIVEDEAVYRWLRTHRLHGTGLSALAMGTGWLPPAWFALAKRFSPSDVLQYLNRVLADAASYRAAHLVFDQLPHGFGPVDNAMLLRVLGDALLCGQAWILPVRRIPNRFITRTDSNVLASLNNRYATQIAFSLIASLEGGQWLRGYVPFKGRTNHVAGQSGMTVATGFDLGQRNEQEMQRFGFSSALMEKLRPFAGLKMRHWTRAAVVAEVARRGPVPILDKAEADTCDREVMGQILGYAIRQWDSGRKHNVPAFRQLPSNWQTVWLSRNYQEGQSPTSPAAVAFRNHALAGRWEDATSQLRSYPEYHERATTEANALDHNFPDTVSNSP